ncbi:MAG: hypothetical protein AAFO91_16625, partial [Bacteroidota bacterium]
MPLTRLRRVISEEGGKLLAVLRILVDSQLQVLAELLVELVELLLILSDLAEQLHALLDNVLTDNLQDLALLKSFSRDVQWQVLAVHNTLNKVCKKKKAFRIRINSTGRNDKK